jgi:hypothetical protein
LRLLKFFCFFSLTTQAEKHPMQGAKHGLPHAASFCLNVEVLFIYPGVVMKKYNIFVLTSIALSSLLALGPLGCSGGGGGASKKADQSPEHDHINQAAAHISNYLSLPENHQKNPKDTSDKDLKGWADKNKIPEDELVSTRDHEPYQIHQLNHGATMIITETTGVNGKKYMFIRSQGRAGAPGGFEATQEEIDNALKPAGKGGRRGGRPG